MEQQDRIGRYVLQTCLGRGGMGEVYLARDPDLDREVAIKLVTGGSGDDTVGKRRQALLLREAVAMARCVHPNVVTIFDVGTHESEVFLAMEYLRGSTLADWEGGNGSLDALVAKYREAGQGLEAAHKAGVVHGDFKPTNVMCTEDGRTVVVDFGIARAAEGSDVPAALDTSDIHLRGAGTPAYMAPELHDGAASTPASDQFAFALALLHGIYRWPLSAMGDRAEVLGQQIRSGALKPVLEPGPSPAMVDALLQGMADRPDDRFPSIGRLLAAIGN